MDRIDKILRYFDPQRFIEVCEARFDTLRTQVVANLQTKTGSSGKRVNSLGVPEWATGATAASLLSLIHSSANGDEIVEEFVKIECYDKQKSLDSIMNMLGYAAPKEVKLSGKIENPAVAPVVIQIDAEDALSIEKTPPADASSA